jgi:hypothetical protein
LSCAFGIDGPESLREPMMRERQPSRIETTPQRKHAEMRTVSLEFLEVRSDPRCTEAMFHEHLDIVQSSLRVTSRRRILSKSSDHWQNSLQIEPSVNARKMSEAGRRNGPDTRIDTRCCREAPFLDPFPVWLVECQRHESLADACGISTSKNRLGLLPADQARFLIFHWYSVRMASRWLER